MPPTNRLSLSSAPALPEIEAISKQSVAVPQRDPIVLLLPRNTDANLLASSTIAMLVATLSRRSGRLVIRDMHNSWTGETTKGRFLLQIDGVAALIYCAALTNNLLENFKNDAAPQALLDELWRRLLTTAKLEERGPSRTYVAVDPEYSVPLELAMGQDGFVAFRNEIRIILRDFRETGEGKHPVKAEAEEDLYRFVYEIFQNTFEHGRYVREGQILAGLRYVRFRQHIGTTASDISGRAAGFEELEKYVARRGETRGTKRFLEITVGDGGLGIVTHFLRWRGQENVTQEERQGLIKQILADKLTSKRIDGAGRGLPNALFALSTLKAFVSLRSEEFWLCRDFSDSDQPQPTSADDAANLALEPVRSSEGQASLTGTQLSVLLDFAH